MLSASSFLSLHSSLCILTHEMLCRLPVDLMQYELIFLLFKPMLELQAIHIDFCHCSSSYIFAIPFYQRFKYKCFFTIFNNGFIIYDFY